MHPKVEQTLDSITWRIVQVPYLRVLWLFLLSFLPAKKVFLSPYDEEDFFAADEDCRPTGGWLTPDLECVGTQSMPHCRFHCEQDPKCQHAPDPNWCCHHWQMPWMNTIPRWFGH